MDRSILNVIYDDPANFPPTINACRIQARAGWKPLLVGFYRGAHHDFVAGEGIAEHYGNRLPGRPTHNVVDSIRDLFLLRRKVGALAAADNPGAVIAYDFRSLWAALPLAGRAKLYFHLHDLPALDGAGLGRLDRLVFGHCLRNLDRVKAVVMPHEERLRLARAAWRFEVPGLTVPNSASLVGPAAALDLRSIVSDAPLPSSARLVVRAGGRGPVQMIDETIAAMAQLSHDYHLCLVGCGDEQTRKRDYAHARAVGVERRVHHVDYMTYDRLRCYLPSGTVGLANYGTNSGHANIDNAATASVKLMEYLAAGLPVVVGPAPDFRELAATTGAMAVTEEETAAGIAKAIRSLADGPVPYQVLRDRATTAWRTTFNYENQYSKVLESLHQADAHSRQGVRQ